MSILDQFMIHSLDYLGSYYFMTKGLFYSFIDGGKKQNRDWRHFGTTLILLSSIKDYIFDERTTSQGYSCYFYIFQLLLHAETATLKVLQIQKENFIMKLGFLNSRFHNLYQFPEQMKDINGAIRPQSRLISQALIASV